MTVDVWWADTLSAFMEAFGVTCKVEHDKRSSVREIGEWWMQGGALYVQLDTSAHARVVTPPEPSSLPESARRMLTISLQSAAAAAGTTLSWREVLTRHFAELARQALTDTWSLELSKSDLTKRLDPVNLPLPGRFAWLVFPQHASDFPQRAGDKEEFQSTVQEVIQEFDAVEFIGWIENPGAGDSRAGHVGHVGDVQSGHSIGHAAGYAGTGRSVDRRGLLLFISQSTELDSEMDGAGAEDAMEGPDSDASHSSPARQAKELHTYIQLLLGSLESDVMVSAKATVGPMVHYVDEWPYGLGGVGQAWREHLWFAPEQGIYVWGERPLLFLLSTLQEQHIVEFLRMVSHPHVPAERDISLAPELAETLEGVLDANLNISEASRLLYLHRNTLMNRIDRIRTQTGYDVRQFEDALLLWMAQSLLQRRREERRQRKATGDTIDR